LKVQDLRAGGYVTRSGAEELNARPGDTITVNAFGKTQSFRVKAIVQDKRLAGSGGISVRREGGVVPLSVAQELFNAPNRLTTIVISNKGDVRGGASRSERVTESAREIASKSSIQLSVLEIKRTGIELSQEASTAFTTFFLVFGLFSIGAGVLLIFMIFVMLAAERKSEMGMARAVGTKRQTSCRHSFRRMGYNVVAPRSAASWAWRSPSSSRRYGRRSSRTSTSTYRRTLRREASSFPTRLEWS
jgi:putative ABC transport system permease protein